MRPSAYERRRMLNMATRNPGLKIHGPLNQATTYVAGTLKKRRILGADGRPARRRGLIFR